MPLPGSAGLPPDIEEVSVALESPGFLEVGYLSNRWTVAAHVAHAGLVDAKRFGRPVNETHIPQDEILARLERKAAERAEPWWVAGPGHVGRWRLDRRAADLRAAYRYYDAGSNPTLRRHPPGARETGPLTVTLTRDLDAFPPVPRPGPFDRAPRPTDPAPLRPKAEPLPADWFVLGLRPPNLNRREEPLRFPYLTSSAAIENPFLAGLREVAWMTDRLAFYGRTLLLLADAGRKARGLRKKIGDAVDLNGGPEAIAVVRSNVDLFTALRYQEVADPAAAHVDMSERLLKVTQLLGLNHPGVLQDFGHVRRMLKPEIVTFNTKIPS
jgi:hypothetical protein